jgi:hypothetical protein
MTFFNISLRKKNDKIFSETEIFSEKWTGIFFESRVKKLKKKILKTTNKKRKEEI